MKTLLFVVIVAFVQVCTGGPIAKREIVPSGLTDGDIEKIRESLKSIPNVDPQAIDSFADIFYNFRENSTDNEILDGTIKLISLACDVDASKLKQIFLAENFSSSEEDTENRLNSIEVKKLKNEAITEDELKDLEDALSKELPPSKTKQVMKIFRGLREDSTAEEIENALIDLLVSAIYGTINKPTKHEGDQMIGDENVIIHQLNENEIQSHKM